VKNKISNQACMSSKKNNGLVNTIQPAQSYELGRRSKSQFPIKGCTTSKKKRSLIVKGNKRRKGKKYFHKNLL